VKGFVQCRFSDDLSAELAEEAEVVLKVKPKVIDTILEHGSTFNTHAKGISCIFNGINTAGFKNIRVYHSASKEFKPSGTFADITAFAATYPAIDIQFRRRFGEWEE